MQSKQHQSEKIRFAGQAKEHLEVLKLGLQEFQTVITDKQRLESLATTAFTFARESTDCGLENLSAIALKVAGVFLAFLRGPSKAPWEAVSQEIEPLLWRSHETLQGMVEMQEMDDILAADVEREVMTGMQPILAQLEAQTCELTGLSALPASLQPSEPVEKMTTLERDLWETADPARSTLDRWVEEANAEGAGDLSGGLPDLDLEGSGDLSDLEDLFGDGPADREASTEAGDLDLDLGLDAELADMTAVASPDATLAAELDALEDDGDLGAIEPEPDPTAESTPSITEADAFEAFEPLEDLEALFAGDEEGEEGDFGAAVDNDVFSELETLTDIPAWAMTATSDGIKEQTWSSDMASAGGPKLALEYFASIEDLEPLLTAAADAGEVAAVAVTGLPFDLAELEAFLEHPATTSIAVAPTPAIAAPQPKAPVRATVPVSRVARSFEQNLKVPVRQMDSLSNLIGELVVNRNSLEQDQERLRRFLDNLLDQVQNLNDLGGRMQDLYERSLLEASLLASRNSIMGNGGNGHSGNGHGGNGPLDDRAGGARDSRDIDPLEIDRFTGFHLISQEMMEMIVRVRESSSDIEFLVDQVDNGARNLRQITTELQENVTSTRMVPFSQIADSLPRAVRDIASKMNKQAKLHVEGRDTLVDKMILEQLYDPLTHLLNNAMTHGIEAPETRAALGKDPSGRIVIRSQHQGNQTIIAISDDGAGIDPGRIKRKAVEKGLISTAEVETLSELEVYDFIFHPGFSTRDKADSYAGRGVGMDVVRSTLSKLRGSITIDSRLGKGTTFTVGLPLTLSIGKALCCIHDQGRIAFPMDGVEDTFDIQPGEIYTNAEGDRYISWQNKKTKARSEVPFKPLGEMLSHNRKRRGAYAAAPKSDEDGLPIVLLRGTGNLVAIQVDNVIGEQEIVIKQIVGPVPKPIGIAGATVLGDGSIMAIADVLETIDLFYGRARKVALDDGMAGDAIEEETTEPKVLIVDDSITVRELLSMSFKKAGYRVEQARDGQEAWDKLRGGLQTDLIFCDIDMPRMDGLELLSRISQDEELSKIPMSMLTSRGADRHRQMAAKFGAKAYFTKPYLEEVLLDAANRMREGEVLI